MKLVFSPSVIATIAASGALQSGSLKVALDSLVTTLNTGAGAGQVNQAYSGEPTIAASGNLSLSMKTFGGALDANGLAFALSKIKVIHIRNVSTDPTAIVRLGGDGTAAAWTSFNGSATVKLIDLNPGDELIYVTSTAAGLAVVASTNELLKFLNLSSTAAAALQMLFAGA